ncbi:hypothetical protein Hanom_Chr10g00914141 [Helianthus anomalus]
MISMNQVLEDLTTDGQSNCSDSEGSDESVARENNDMEDEEIRPEVQVSPEIQPGKTDSQEVAAVEKPANGSLHGNTNGLHRESNDMEAELVSPRVTADINASGTRNVGAQKIGNPFHMGCSDNMG